MSIQGLFKCALYSLRTSYSEVQRELTKNKGNDDGVGAATQGSDTGQYGQYRGGVTDCSHHNRHVSVGLPIAVYRSRFVAVIKNIVW